ncbi:hypothetical protein QUF82_10265 [Thiotrichales bacterium HSG14]|nr:hypothetical protein [Thiotrichales bacterium HSG14]
MQIDSWANTQIRPTNITAYKSKHNISYQLWHGSIRGNTQIQ